MIRRRAYPTTYDRTTWEARQNDLESQHMAVSDPYDNSVQADIRSLGYDTLQEDQALADAAATNPDTSGAAPSNSLGQPGGNFVRYTWDSRPVAAWDWYSGSVNTALNLLTDQTGRFTVPQGMIAIVRTMTFTPAANVGPVIDVTGLPLNNYYVTIVRNGVPVPGFTLIDCSPGFPSGGEIECFIMCQAGDVIQGNAFLGGVQVDNFTTVTQPAGFRFWGTVIPNDGRSLPEQAANALCEPVCLDAASLAAMQPPLVVPTPQGPMVVTNPSSPASPKAAKNCPLPPLVSVNDYLACVLSP